MADPWPIHTLVFDLDDTLFDEAEFVRSGFRAAGEWLREQRGVTGFTAKAERLFADGKRGRIFDEALVALGHAADPQLIAQLIACYRDHRPTLTLLEDAREILDWADGRFRLALISDGYHETQSRKFEALGIAPRFQVPLFTDALGREFWKPHPAAFERVMQQLPGDAGGYVYIADNPRKDFIAPHKLGWKTIRVRRAAGEHRDYEPTPTEAADVEVTSLVELKRWIVTVK